MQTSKVDSVVGYLDPKKLLTKSNRSAIQPQLSPTNYLNQCQSNFTSPPRRQKQSYRKKRNEDNQQKMYQTDKELSDGRQLLNRMFNKTQGQMKSGEGNDPQQLNFQDNIKMDDLTLQQGERYEKFNKTSSQDNDQQKQCTYRSDVVGFKRKGLQSSVLYEIKSRKLSTSNKKNPQISQLVIKQYLQKLTTVKNTLQQQIDKLKTLLDQVEATQQDMDSQFEEFKKKILAHVSKALDSSFRQYKNNLPKWQQYEEVQQIGQKKKNKIQQLIQSCQDQQKFKLAGGRDRMEKNIEEGIQVIKKIKQSFQQANDKMPYVSEEKIKKFQILLQEIGKF